MTQRQQSVVDRYNRSSMTELYEAYGKFSGKKREAWDKCKALRYKHKGKDLKIISANRYQFSAGCTYTNDEGKKCLLYITKAGTETIPMEG